MASAVLIGAYASRPDLAFLPYVGLVPWVILYTDAKRARVPAAYHLVSSWLYWMIAYRHTFQHYGWFAEFVVSLIGMAAFLWLFGPMLSRLHGRFSWPRAVTVPIAWVTMEWLRGVFMLGHFDYLSLGYSQARFPLLIQIADLVGVHGISFLVASVDGVLADLYFALRDRRWSPRAVLEDRRLAWAAGSVAAAFLLTAGYGYYRLGQVEEGGGPRIAVVQPNVAHTIRNACGVYLTEVMMTDWDVPTGSADLILWPENAVLDNIR